jgi:Fic family protein
METLNEIIVNYVMENPLLSSKDIHDGLGQPISYATLKRKLNTLIEKNYIEPQGKGKGTKYQLSEAYAVIKPIAADAYFEKEIDERNIMASFNFELMPVILPKVSIFTKEELNMLDGFQKKYLNNIKALSTTQYPKELERLAIDLSWKSSQIEGNTYSLLETERLLKERETASGKTKEEAMMLLNHKAAIDFIVANPDYLNPLTVKKIEDIHGLLMKELGVDKNIRKRSVGISGTNYKPLDNDFQILEALTNMCELVNGKENVFEKALLSLMLISYIQPFEDGNKRTARIVSNAILINYQYCPISFRTVDSIEYKKAMLIFYEKNNISNFKKIFIDQFKFAVNTYF